MLDLGRGRARLVLRNAFCHDCMTYRPAILFVIGQEM